MTRRVRTQDWDAVAASTPNDQVAGRVVGQTGEHYEPDLNLSPGQFHRETPPKMRRYESLPGNAQQVYREMVGKKIGAFTVLGIAAFHNQDRKSASWVIRCKCGRYETRKLRRLRNPDQGMMIGCKRCDRIAYHRERYDQEGGRAIEDFVPKDKR